MKIISVTFDPQLRNPNFWILGITGCLIAINLDITWTTSQSIDQVVFKILAWGAVIFLSWQQRHYLCLKSDIISTTVGLIFIAWVMFRSLFSSINDDILANISPLISALSVCLLASGFNNLKQYTRELAIVFLSIFPTEPLLPIIGKVLGVDISILVSTITSKFSAFVLWYLGFETERLGVNIILPGGAITIYDRCSGLDDMILLLQIACIVLVIFPLGTYKKLILLISAVILAFIVNSIRVALMAFLVAFSNRAAFDYWHGGDGAQIFSTIAIFVFWWFCKFVVTQGEPQVMEAVELKEE
ncbi:MAG TPA: cyanoexosortase A [Oculatellaceae cyanobacterium]|jgi:cyanoexosortase A